MDLVLSFRNGLVTGSGNDRIGAFDVRGRYEVIMGTVMMQKQYVGAHVVRYRGFNEVDKGIWGVWQIAQYMKGGFHIWPMGMADPTTHSVSRLVRRSGPSIS